MHALPPDLDPLVTTHPVSAAYRVEGDLAGRAWTQDEQEAIARAVVALDRERKIFLTDNGGGTMRWALEAAT